MAYLCHRATSLIGCRSAMLEGGTSFWNGRTAMVSTTRKSSTSGLPSEWLMSNTAVSLASVLHGIGQFSTVSISRSSMVLNIRLHVSPARVVHGLFQRVVTEENSVNDSLDAAFTQFLTPLRPTSTACWAT